MTAPVGVICGGTGSSKFVLGFKRYLHSKNKGNTRLGFIANVADNFWYRDLYVCPDLDIIVYALSGLLNSERGWGLASDSFFTKDAYARLSQSYNWFNLGDKDLALSLRRTELMKMGWNLSSITDEFCSRLGIEHDVIPSSNDIVQTFIRTRAGVVHIQEYWVKHNASSAVTQVEYVDVNNAQPNPSVFKFLSSKVVLCPANPITSIMPTISLKGVKKSLSKAKVLAVSPFTGSTPFSGPAASLMRGVGLECSSYGVASLYKDFLKIMLVETTEDPQTVRKIRDLGVECIQTQTRIQNDTDQINISKEILDML